MIEYDQDYPGRSTDNGIILTKEGKFIEFDMDLNKERTELIELYIWKDITQRYEINAKKKGIGKTYGYLAMEVLKELNQSEV